MLVNEPKGLRNVSIPTSKINCLQNWLQTSQISQKKEGNKRNQLRQSQCHVQCKQFGPFNNNLSLRTRYGFLAAVHAQTNSFSQILTLESWPSLTSVHTWKLHVTKGDKSIHGWINGYWSIRRCRARWKVGSPLNLWNPNCPPNNQPSPPHQTDST